MLEKDIENLIALYPERFFPDQGFTLVGQQVNLGKCRADLVFKDKHKRTIIIEVKRGVLDREASGQIIEYYGLLKQENPNEIVELILCANTIPAERKLFLERVGIECKELGLALIPNLAREKGYPFLDDSKEKVIVHTPIQDLVSRKEVTFSSIGSVWIFQTDPTRYNILNALAELKQLGWQVNQHKDKIKKGDIALIWMSGKDAGIYAVSRVISDPEVRFGLPEEDKYCLDESLLSNIKGNMVIIEINKNMSNAPLFRQEIKKIEGLRVLNILKQAQGTNFPVTQEEWAIIKEKIRGL